MARRTEIVTAISPAFRRRPPYDDVPGRPCETDDDGRRFGGSGRFRTGRPMPAMTDAGRRKRNVPCPDARPPPHAYLRLSLADKSLTMALKSSVDFQSVHCFKNSLSLMSHVCVFRPGRRRHA